MINMAYGLGIDAGGTYTDVVLLEFASGQVVVADKAPTTRADPALGIRAGLARIDAELLSQVSMVSLATTFATNAIVEDMGAEAGLILIGYDERPPEIPETTAVLMVGGGHRVTGEQKSALDIQYLEENLETFARGLAAVAVAGFFSVRNPEHEIRVAELVHSRFGLPVVQGHQLSLQLNAMKRATTAWWNARLIPLIGKLILATTEVLGDMGVTAPLMVVRGDGTLMSADTAESRPVDTLLSGPAASILGAKHLAGIDNALIVDMGGTTTDMAALCGGRVVVDPLGAKVGRWETLVQAARVKTVGIGGDSIVSINGGRQLQVGPRRVVPLCIFVQRHPEVLAMLQTIQRRMSATPYRNINPCSFYANTGGHSANDDEFLASLTARPVSEFLRQGDSCKWPATWRLERLEQRGLVERSSLTPTDICVATGGLELGNKKAAQSGLAVFSRFLGMTEAALAEAVRREICRQLCLQAVSFLEGGDDTVLSKFVNRWFQQAGQPAGSVRLNVDMSLSAPVIGAGAPAASFLPATFRRLHTDCLLPRNYQVSVAVGAVVGMVDFTLVGTIRRTPSRRYTLYTAAGREDFDTFEESLQQGRERLENLAWQRMLRNRVRAPQLEFQTVDKKVPSGHGDEVYLETELRLRAWGRPNVEEQEGEAGE
ncbi:MAG: hydantoinase/oxoprolinase family protein [Deltaproteobacteria bacterium]|nr:hydantoinase/oxoprolinase family protein [Deltaproteobacteria bacterium]MBW2071812.1 hydantoinase/oxoprolinase family protein [Deltaproteobacteria bacterium]